MRMRILATLLSLLISSNLFAGTVYSIKWQSDFLACQNFGMNNPLTSSSRPCHLSGTNSICPQPTIFPDPWNQGASVNLIGAMIGIQIFNSAGQQDPTAYGSVIIGNGFPGTADWTAIAFGNGSFSKSIMFPAGDVVLQGPGGFFDIYGSCPAGDYEEVTITIPYTVP